MAHNAADHRKGNHKAKLTESLAVLMVIIGVVVVAGFLIVMMVR
jgi:hypothetical protein